MYILVVSVSVHFLLTAESCLLEMGTLGVAHTCSYGGYYLGYTRPSKKIGKAFIIDHPWLKKILVHFKNFENFYFFQIETKIV